MATTVPVEAAATAVQELPRAVALLMALVSVASKEALFHVTKAVGEQNNSRTLIANSYHHRSDAFSSVVAAVGTMASIFGFHLVDPLAALAVGGMILKSAAEVAFVGF